MTYNMKNYPKYFATIRVKLKNKRNKKNKPTNKKEIEICMKKFLLLLAKHYPK